MVQRLPDDTLLFGTSRQDGTPPLAAFFLAVGLVPRPSSPVPAATKPPVARRLQRSLGLQRGR